MRVDILVTKLWKRENWRHKAKSFAHPASLSVHWCGKCQNINVRPPLGSALSQKVCERKKSSQLKLSCHILWAGDRRVDHDGHKRRLDYHSGGSKGGGKLRPGIRYMLSISDLVRWPKWAWYWLCLWRSFWQCPDLLVAGCSILSHATLPYVHTLSLSSCN